METNRISWYIMIVIIVGVTIFHICGTVYVSLARNDTFTETKEIILKYENSQEKEAIEKINEIIKKLKEYIRTSLMELAFGLIESMVVIFIKPIYELIKKLAYSDKSFSEYSSRIILISQIVAGILFLYDIYIAIDDIKNYMTLLSYAKEIIQTTNLLLPLIP
ncbi:hypothetical protein CDLVIII_0159 [Clostridium sp. DL-VIII]|uniref:hypothetical protein n=1 Tax=Clostridium sp. DL-VIII TaxID=641107 RepID=UPI00023AF80A|nr:hypothetical protein [Clostridium sp. DL-VIII]EHI96898.1 hypothetical protein CDLVIII_0159 [Clostridium sp. DL-VIII]